MILWYLQLLGLGGIVSGYILTFICAHLIINLKMFNVEPVEGYDYEAQKKLIKMQSQI